MGRFLGKQLERNGGCRWGVEGVYIQVIQIYTGLALEHHCLVARAGNVFLLSVVPSIKHSMAGTDKTSWYARGVIQLSKH